MPDTTVKLFQSTDTGAPTLTYAAGSLLGVLDACLVNGYGSVTLTSLVVSGNVATATCNAGHGFTAFYSTNPVIQINGATPGELNGEWRLASIPDSTHFTFATSGISDQTATGTITAKRSPAGWTKPYSGTNLAAYRNNATQGTGSYLRVDDTGTYEARSVGYESMTGINTGSGDFPTAAQVTGGAFWVKAYNGHTTARKWILVANDRIFYFFSEFYNASGFLAATAFGDIASLKSGDAYRAILIGFSSSSYNSSGSVCRLFYGSDSGSWMPRSYTGLGSGIVLTKVLMNSQGSAGLSGNMTDPYPNGPDNALSLYAPILLRDASSHIRGSLPGLLYSPQTLGVNIATGFSPVEIPNVPLLDNGVAVAVALYHNSASGTGFFDPVGPWAA